MTENNPNNVRAALDVLLKELEAQINTVDSAAAKAFQEHDYRKAKEALKRLEILTAFKDRAASLRREWDRVQTGVLEEQTGTGLRSLGRLPRGQRTPIQEFVIPILRALSEMGGRGTTEEVLERVHDMMAASFSEVDFEQLPSHPGVPRWRNTAQWARFEMTLNGLLRDDSPRGIWEITPKGRALLEEHQ